jgi:uncharacterized RmlC-like cupin family protein
MRRWPHQEEVRRMTRVQVVRESETRIPDVTTPGMDRHEAFAGDGVWAGTVRTEPGMLTGWHDHGAFDTYIYVFAGDARIEYGPGGREAVDLGPGDWIHLPKGTIHREGSAAGSRGAEAVLVRVGTGEVVVNHDGPEPG